MIDFDELLARLDEQMARLESCDEATRALVFQLLDEVDLLHRFALHRLSEYVDTAALERARGAEPLVAWLAEAYGLDVDQRDEAVAALDVVRPFLRSHGGDVEVLSAAGGIVRVRLAGACQGCTASSITLRNGVEEALRDHLPGFVVLDVESDEATPHPPPGPTLDDPGVTLGRNLPLHPA